MRIFTLFIFAFSFCAGVQAQITVNHWDITLDPAGETVSLTGLDSSAVSIPQTGADMVWDYSGISTIGNSTLQYNPVSNPDFPNANLSLDGTYKLLGGLATLPSQNNHIRNDQGFYFSGRTNMALGLPLVTFTGNPADTLFALATPKKESNPLPFVQFPLNYGDTSTTVSLSSSYYVGEAPTFGLSNYSIQEQSTTTSSIDVAGWGKLILTDPATMQLDTFEVLLQKRTRTLMRNYIDAAGNATPSTLLGAFGIADSSSTTITYHYFYAKGVNRYTFIIYEQNGAVIRAQQNDEAFTKAFNVNTEETKVQSVTHRVSPNPVQNHQFQLNIDKNNSENWQLDIYNLVGQTVHQEAITDNNSNVYLDSNLSTGHYFYSVKNENGQVVARGKLML